MYCYVFHIQLFMGVSGRPRVGSRRMRIITRLPGACRGAQKVGVHRASYEKMCSSK